MLKIKLIFKNGIEKEKDNLKFLGKIANSLGISDENVRISYLIFNWTFFLIQNFFELIKA